jgi:hypothetical protein
MRPNLTYQNRFDGAPVTHDELLALFSDVQGPWYVLWMAVARYSRQIAGAEIILVKGQGYVLVEEEE